MRMQYVTLLLSLLTLCFTGVTKARASKDRGGDFLNPINILIVFEYHCTLTWIGDLDSKTVASRTEFVLRNNLAAKNAADMSWKHGKIESLVPSDPIIVDGDDSAIKQSTKPYNVTLEFSLNDEEADLLNPKAYLVRLNFSYGIKKEEKHSIISNVGVASFESNSISLEGGTYSNGLNENQNQIRYGLVCKK